MTTLTSLPHVSLAAWDDPTTDRAAFARRVADICHEVGFFTLVDHGIAQSTIDGYMSMLRQFFALSEEVKATIEKVGGALGLKSAEELDRLVGGDRAGDLALGVGGSKVGEAIGEALIVRALVAVVGAGGVQQALLHLIGTRCGQGAADGHHAVGGRTETQ